MKCKHCQKEYFNSEQFCNICGTQLKPIENTFFQNTSGENLKPIETLENEQMNIESPILMPHEKMKLEQTNVNYSNFTEPNNSFKEEDWLKVYIGKNYDKIHYKKWSWPAFLFGLIYLIYRKLWKYAGLYMIIMLCVSLISNVLNLPILLTIGGLILSSISGIKFNEIYVKYAKEHIRKLHEANPIMSQEEFSGLVASKGGTNLAVTLLLTIPLAICIAIMIFFFTLISPFIPQISKNKAYCETAICNEDRTNCMYFDDNGRMQMIDCS